MNRSYIETTLVATIHGPAMLRVAIPGLGLLGFVVYWAGGVLGFWSGGLSENQKHALWFVIGFFLFAVYLALWILAHPHVSAKRRYNGIVADIAGNTYFMAVSGELA